MNKNHENVDPYINHIRIVSIICCETEKAPNSFTNGENGKFQPNIITNLENTNTIHIDHIRIVSIIWSKIENAPNHFTDSENGKS